MPASTPKIAGLDVDDREVEAGERCGSGGAIGGELFGGSLE